jgi:hypothetical protein
MKKKISTLMHCSEKKGTRNQFHVHVDGSKRSVVVDWGTIMNEKMK